MSRKLQKARLAAFATARSREVLLGIWGSDLGGTRFAFIGSGMVKG
jgi:hypothetical protein